MAVKRDKLDIIMEILHSCIEGASKTGIVYRVNLNFRTVNPYLELLTRKELIKLVRNPSNIYITTDRGVKLLHDLRAVHHEIVEVDIDAAKKKR